MPVDSLISQWRQCIFSTTANDEKRLMSHNDDTNQLQWNKLSLDACMKGKCCAFTTATVSTGNTKTTAPPIALKTINKQQESASTPEHPDLHCAWTSQKWWSSAGFHHWSCSFTNTSNKSYLVADDTTELSLSRADITGLAWTWVPNNVAIDAVIPVPSAQSYGDVALANNRCRWRADDEEQFCNSLIKFQPQRAIGAFIRTVPALLGWWCTFVQWRRKPFSLSPHLTSAFCIFLPFLFFLLIIVCVCVCVCR